MKRIQRKRTKGWRMPASAKYIGRPTRFGNPFDWQDYLDQWTSETKARQLAASDYRNWLAGMYGSLWSTRRNWILEHLEELRGFDQACWCKSSEPCHADVLIELLNECKVSRGKNEKGEYK